MSKTTLIKQAEYVVAWSQERQQHVYMTNVDVAFCDDQIVHVGANFQFSGVGTLETISGRDH